jgi:pimeloyl-ACP methyl ester carboxylesterase
MASEVERVPLPPSMLGDLVPDRALVQRVRIGGLTLLAIPGEMTAGSGVRLRSRVERDTRLPTVLVGCANDHLGYFAGETEWREAGYESLMSFYGPDAADVLARALGAADAPDPPGPGGGKLEDRGGTRFVKLWGSPREMGRAHGRLLRGAIRAMLAEVEVEVRRQVLGQDLPVKVRGVLALYPQAKRLLFPLMAARARSLHRFVPEDLVEEMKGVAEGAGIPYDAVFLMNTFLTLAEQTDRDVLLKLPANCTNAVLFGTASRDERLLLARNLDWGMTEILPRYATVTLYEPERGHPFLSVGWAGMTGTLTAMNRAGIAITEESVKDPSDTDLDGVPIMLLLRDAIQRSGTLDEAVRRVRDASGTCGYHVTIASGREHDARVVEVSGTRATVRHPADGVLLGCGGEPNRRYRWLRERLGERAEPLGPKELLSLFKSGDGGLANDGTLHSVLMIPETGGMLVAQGRVPATTGTYRLFDLDREATGRGSAPPTPPVEVEPLTSTRRSVRVQRVWFHSEKPSGAPENDHFPVEHYVPEGTARGAIVVLPIWKGTHPIAERIVAGHLARRGYQAAILPLAWQFRRSPRGVRSGHWTVSSDLDRTKAALEQSGADVRTVLTWLRARDDVKAGRVGVLGISLGAHVAAVVYRRDPRIRAGVLVMAGADPAGIVWSESRETRRMKRELLARGVTLATLREYFAPMDPAAPLDAPERPAYSRHRGILMVNGTEDRVIPPESGRELHESLGRPEIAWIEANHYSMALRIHEVLARTDRHLDRIFR